MKKNFTYQIGESATFTDFGRMDLDMLNYKTGIFNQRNYQLSKGQIEAQFKLLNLGVLQIWVQRFNGRMAGYTQAPDGHMMLNLCEEESGIVQTTGKTLKNNVFSIMSKDGEENYSTSSGMIAVTFNEEYFRQFFETTFKADFPSKISSGIFFNNLPILNRLRLLARHMLVAANRISMPFDPFNGFNDTLDESVMLEIGRLIIASDDVLIKKSNDDFSINSLKKAICFIHDHLGEKITYSDLCNSAGIGERSLRNAFQKHFDSTVVDYIRKIRLNHIHTDLKQINDPIKVSDIAHKHGLLHMGHFSRDYKSLFGESPKATQKKQFIY